MADVELDDGDVARILLQLQALDAQLPEVGRRAGSDAADIVARSARWKIPLGPSEGGHLRFTVRSVGPRVSMGGPFFPYAGWLNWGGRVGKDHKVYRPYLPMGRYLAPSYLEHYLRINLIMDDKVADACHVAGFEVD